MKDKPAFLADLEEVTSFFQTDVTKMRNLAIEGLCSSYCLECQEANDAKKAPLIPEG